MLHRPIVRSLGRVLLIAALTLGFSSPLLVPAVAQETPADGPAAEARPVPQVPSPQCRRYRAELASLQTGASTTRALNDEIGRLEAYYRGLNCTEKFLFFDTRPPQCGAVEQRIRALKATYGGAVLDDDGTRRRELQGLVASTCPAREVYAAGGESYARGGSQMVCVRSCDGGFFPMRNLPEGRGSADEMCQALCPGTEAQAYSMPYGDDALKHAATVKGSRAYTSLANAFKFRKEFVPNCSCKPEGKTWAQSLVKAESMLVRHKGDIFVTPMQAEALSRPKVRLTLVGRADRTAAELAADAAGRAGVGPKGDGETADTNTGNGEPEGTVTGSVKPDHVAVRIIAPNVIAVPQRLTP
ncbi:MULTISPECIES: DUF2865 domain-containing protein [unclassified Methylobacterium]|jgi:Protein of unknown function (DUF2865)|uniref:DUF2865 domain-containing protein n=1 Tax=unclassified Methylobacterium TaxID=2615210 RepID=UPI0013555CBD|nr:DUF2865 domain-containing protein [Methylobacterium sp. 2A]MWV25697.1 DUF2865 domain-containing protein [Methylobacterium sp. 2A]